MSTRTRCDDCAFTVGTVPNLYPPSKLRADLSLVSGDAFLCHHGDKPVCQGWIEERVKQCPVPEWRRDVARTLSDVFEEATEGKWVDVTEKELSEITGQLEAQPECTACDRPITGEVCWDTDGLAFCRPCYEDLCREYFALPVAAREDAV